MKVTYEDLTVRNADLDPSGDGGKGKEYSYKLLKKLEEAGFVREVQESEPGSGIVKLCLFFAENQKSADNSRGDPGNLCIL